MDSKEKLKLASMIAGIFSIIFLIFGFALPLGALGLLFALLSRDTEKFEGRAMTGFILSLIGLIIGGATTVSSLYLLTSGTYEKMLEEYYGDTEEENDYLEQLKEYFQQLNEQNEPTGCVTVQPDEPAFSGIYDDISYTEISIGEVRL